MGGDSVVDEPITNARLKAELRKHNSVLFTVDYLSKITYVIAASIHDK